MCQNSCFPGNHNNQITTIAGMSLADPTGKAQKSREWSLYPGDDPWCGLRVLEKEARGAKGLGSVVCIKLVSEIERGPVSSLLFRIPKRESHKHRHKTAKQGRRKLILALPKWSWLLSEPKGTAEVSPRLGFDLSAWIILV